MLIEPATPKDRLFILRNMVQGMAALDRRVEQSTAARWAYGSVVRYLNRSSSRLTVLSLPPWQAPRAFLAAEEVQNVRVVHWVHVEPTWRRTGAANALLDEALGSAPAIVTHLTREGRELLGQRSWEFVPQVWHALLELDDWKLAGSTRHHMKQFLAAAEHFGVDKRR